MSGPDWQPSRSDPVGIPADGPEDLRILDAEAAELAGSCGAADLGGEDVDEVFGRAGYVGRVGHLVTPL